MAQHNELGKKGELIAVDFFKKSGHKIAATNWRYLKAEIDLIVLENDRLVFIEVKTRSSIRYGHPTEAVTLKKQALMKDAAEAYLSEKNLALEIRFDIISIILNANDHSIEHLKNAF